jgi:hypothetical protein
MKDWQSQTHVKRAGRSQGTIVPKYREQATYGTNHVSAMGFDERTMRQDLQGKKTVRSGRTNMF